MKKQTFLKITTMASLALLCACGEQQKVPDSNLETKANTEQTSKTNVDDQEKQSQEIPSDAPLVVEEEAEQKLGNLFTVDNLGYILQHTDYEMFDDGGPDHTETYPETWTPSGWEKEVVYAQVVFVKGEVRAVAYVVFFPQIDGAFDRYNGTLSSKVYKVIPQEDFPCYVCELESIALVDGTNKDYSVIKGVFKDLADTDKKIIKYMEANFSEMFFKWTDDEIYNF